MDVKYVHKSSRLIQKIPASSDITTVVLRHCDTAVNKSKGNVELARRTEGWKDGGTREQRGREVVVDEFDTGIDRVA
jgi:hypothetical protein